MVGQAISMEESGWLFSLTPIREKHDKSEVLSLFIMIQPKSNVIQEIPSVHVVKSYKAPGFGG